MYLNIIYCFIGFLRRRMLQPLSPGAGVGHPVPLAIANKNPTCHRKPQLFGAVTNSLLISFCH